MDNDTKKFFEKLSGIEDQNEGGEFEPQLVKADTSAVKTKKGEKEIDPEENNLADDIFEDSEGQLTIDVYQTADTIVVESTIAGVADENLDISITPESVTIRGKREKEEKVKTDDYLYQECYWGRFSRSIILPQEIDPDRAHASLKNGVLKIVLPKLNRQKTKKLKVKFN